MGERRFIMTMDFLFPFFIFETFRNFLLTSSPFRFVLLFFFVFPLLFFFFRRNYLTYFRASNIGLYISRSFSFSSLFFFFFSENATPFFRCTSYIFWSNWRVDVFFVCPIFLLLLLLHFSISFSIGSNVLSRTFTERRDVFEMWEFNDRTKRHLCFVGRVVV